MKLRRLLVISFLVLISGSTTIPVPAQLKTTHSLAQCVEQETHLLVSMVIDESGSLKQTDPDDDRLVAAKAALAQLASIANEPSSEDSPTPTVEVAIGGFSESFVSRSGWQKVNSSSLGRLFNTVDQFAERDTGIDTDFYFAIHGAKWALENRIEALSKDGRSACSVLLLFTDGEYDIEPGAGRSEKTYAEGIRPTSDELASQVERIGERKICERNGLSDQARSLGIVPIVISLNKTAFDQSFIKGFATGSSCGAKGPSVPGVFDSASDLTQLLQLFDAIVGNIGGGVLEDRSEVPVCPRRACLSGRRTFVIDDALRRFHLLVDLGAPGIVSELRRPGRTKPLRILAGDVGQLRFGSGNVSLGRLSEAAFTADVSRPEGGKGWAGKWSITFIDPTGENPGAVVDSQIFLYGDLIPSFVGTPRFRIGEVVELEVEVVRQDGEPLPPEGFVQETSLRLSVTDPTEETTRAIPVERANGENFIAEYQVPSTTDSSVLNVTAELTTKTSTGLALVPTTATIAVPVLPPADYPSLLEPTIDFDPLIGADEPVSTTTQVVVVGPQNGSGCVWFKDASFRELPPETSRPTLTFEPDATSAPDCVAVPSGERKTVALTLTEPPSRAHASGDLLGDLTVVFLNEERVPLEKNVPFSGRVFAAPCPGCVPTAILLVILGTGLPLLALWALNYFAAKFQAPGHLRSASIPILVKENSVERQSSDPSANTFSPDDFRNVPAPEEPVRAFEWEGLRFEARVPWNPFGTPWGEARGSYVTGSRGRRRKPGYSKAEIDLSLTRNWIFILDESSINSASSEPPNEVSGHLYLFVSSTEPTLPQAESIWDAVESALPAAAFALAAAFNEDRERSEPPPPPPPGEEPEPESGIQTPF